jgi:trk system potassium uptake protein TrkA
MHRRVLIAGEGRVLYFVARSFKAAKVEVAVVAKHERDALALSRSLDVLVILGDPTQPRFLEEAGAGKSTDVVAATEKDEDNLVICQLAKRLFGVERTIALVQDPDYVEVFRELEVDAVISTTDLLAKVVRQRTALEELEDLVPVVKSPIRVTDVSLVEGDPSVGKNIQELDLPAACLVGVVVRGEEVFLPKGDFVLEQGDRAVIIVTRQAEEEAIRVLKKGG